MRIVRDLKAEGCAILYVSHRLEEIFALCDSASVLRDGKLVASHDALASISKDQLISEMAGRAIADIYAYRRESMGEPSVEVSNLVGPGLAAPVSFAARQGEIVGFFGLVGAGRSELFKLVFGATRASAGEVRVKGKPAPLCVATRSDRRGAGALSGRPQRRRHRAADVGARESRAREQQRW